MTFSSKTIAITVTYNPDLEILRDQLESLKSQCNVIIVDNASKKDLFKSIKEFSKTYEHVQLIARNENIGISCAQNIGFQHVIKSLPEVRFALLLDHDSVPSKEMVQRLEKDFKALQDAGINLAAIGPLMYDPRDKKYLGFHIIRNGLWKKIIPAKNSAPVECQSLNSSGSLISLEAITTVGKLDESFFMDHGETEWCFRAINKGYKIFGSARATMNHLMGDEVCVYWLFGRRRMPYRSPLRHYYITRNSILLQKRPYVPWNWKIMNLLKILFTFVYFGFFAKESGKHRFFIKKGLLDGLRGITGELLHKETVQ